MERTETPALTTVADTAPSPARSSAKLPNGRFAGRPRPVRNEWLAADRFERWRPVFILAILAAVFAVGAGLIVSGLAR